MFVEILKFEIQLTVTVYGLALFGFQIEKDKTIEITKKNETRNIIVAALVDELVNKFESLPFDFGKRGTMRFVLNEKNTRLEKIMVGVGLFCARGFAFEFGD